MFLAIPYCLCIKHWETILGEGNGGVKGGAEHEVTGWLSCLSGSQGEK